MLSIVGAGTSLASNQNIFFRGIAKVDDSQNAEASPTPTQEVYVEKTPALVQENPAVQAEENIPAEAPKSPEKKPIKSACQPGSLPVIKQGKITSCSK